MYIAFNYFFIFTMKSLIIVIFSVFVLKSVNAQSNLGLKVGGNFSTLRGQDLTKDGLSF